MRMLKTKNKMKSHDELIIAFMFLRRLHYLIACVVRYEEIDGPGK